MATWKKIITSGSTAELNHISASGNIIPITTDGSSLGSVSHNFSDLFLDSGAVINLDGGDVTLTHSSNKLTLGGGSLEVDGGIAIDNITIDGTEIDLSSGDLTIDAHAGDIILDAAGKDISLTDGAGTAEFIFNLEDAPELDVDGDFTIDGSGKITLDSAATNINLIGNVTASGVVSSSGGFIGGLTGTADVATVATTVTITDNESTDEDNAIVFTAGGDVDGGNIGLESDGTLNYNPSSGKLTATQLAGTLQTAAQTNITDVGALDEGSITSGFGTINNGASAITTTGTVSAGRVNTTGGVHVGGTADPGTDNLIVDGITTLTGNVTASGVISASGGFVGDGSNLTGVGTDIDGLGALGGTGLHQTQDHFLFSDNGTEKKITFSNLEDAIFGNVSGNATVAAGGALTIADDGVVTDNITDANVTLAKIANAGANTVIVRDANSAGVLSAKALTTTQILIGDGSGFTAAALSGDVTMTNGGVVSVADNKIGNAELKQDDAITLQSLTLTGDLTVNGTTTTIATTNTLVQDQFMFLGTGSAGTNTDIGIIAQSGSADLSGSAFYHDTNSQRWSVAKGIQDTVTAVTPLQFVSTVKTEAVNPNTTSGSYGAGEMHVNTTTGEIWVRFG